MATTGNQVINGNLSNDINNSGGYVIVNGNTNGNNITNTGGDVVISAGGNSNSIITNSGGAVIVSHNSNGSTLSNLCNITIGHDANTMGSSIADPGISISNGILSIGHSFNTSFLNMNGRAITILPAGNQTNSTYNFGSGSNFLLIDPNITGTGNQNYTNGGIQFLNFDFANDAIILPDIYGPYTYSYSSPTLVITGTSVIYTFENIPAPPSSSGSLTLVGYSLSYTFVTPASADALGMISSPPSPTTQTYTNYYKFGLGNPPETISSCIVCFSGESMILTKNILTNEINEVKARNVISSIHQVFNTQIQEFVPIKLNVVNGPTKRFIKISKDLIAENKPNMDFYVTSGHDLLINGDVIKPTKIIGSIVSKVESQNVYSIVCDEKIPIQINNLDVFTYGYDEWDNYSRKRNIKWYDNKL